MNKLDVNQIRQEFSMYQNKEFTYLDSAATTLTPDVVVDAMSDYYKHYRSSVYRGNYKLGQKATNLFDDARQTIANYFTCKAEEIIFTKGTTASLNLVAKSLEAFVSSGDEILISNLEHHSNFLPWLNLANKTGANLVIVKSENNQLTVEQIKNQISSKTKIVALHHLSNVIGNEVDIQELTKITSEQGIISVIDGAQGAAHQKVDFSQVKCDFYTVSAHKMFGPTGLGVLYINQEVQTKIAPFEYGGGMVETNSVDYNDYAVKVGTHKFEAGTPAIAEVIGFGAAIKFIEKIGIEKIRSHEEDLKQYAVQKFQEIKDKAIIYNPAIKSAIVIFNIKNVAVHDALNESPLSNVTFDGAGIAIRDGQHCNNLTMKHVLKEKAVLRASFSIYNDYQDIDRLVEQIKKIYEVWN